MRRAQAARQQAHADFQKPILRARRQRVITRHGRARRQDAHQIARRKVPQAGATPPARPGKAQDGRGLVAVLSVALARYQRERGGGARAAHSRAPGARPVPAPVPGPSGRTAGSIAGGCIRAAAAQASRRAQGLLQCLGKGAEGRVLPVAKAQHRHRHGAGGQFCDALEASLACAGAWPSP